MASVKWLTRIEALDTPDQGFQQVQTYRFRENADDPGRPATDMRVKSLRVLPGVPDWGSRLRFLRAGIVTVRGRATDAEGHVQPLSAPWDLAGFGNNMVHEVGVFVR